MWRTGLPYSWHSYTTKDPTWHTWGVAPGPKFINAGENGDQWFSKIANLKDGSPPPAVILFVHPSMRFHAFVNYSRPYRVAGLGGQHRRR